MKPIDEFIQDKFLPRSTNEMERWAKMFYDSEPFIRDFVDEIYRSFGRKPTNMEIRDAIFPFFKLLLYRDYCKGKYSEEV